MAEKAVKMPFFDNFSNFLLIFLQMLNVGLIKITFCISIIMFGFKSTQVYSLQTILFSKMAEKAM